LGVNEQPHRSGVAVQAERKTQHPLRNRAFRLLWIGNTISWTGDQFYIVALPWLVLSLTGSSIVLGAMEMIAATKKYFEGYEQKNASIVPFASECSTQENGMATTNNPNGPVMDPAHPNFHVFGGSCAEEITQGFFASIEKPRDAWPLVVDEEQGLVLNLALYDNEGNVKSVDVAGVGAVAVPRNFLRPITFLKPQLFKIEGGKIREIEGLSWPVPFGIPSGWK
jgi:hypothetical protein